MKEAIYSLSVLSILIKVLFSLGGIEFPVNLTLVFIPLLIGVMWYQLSIDRFVLHFGDNLYPVLGLIVFWGWMFITAIYSPSNNFKVEKLFLFSLNIILFLYPLVVKLNFRLFFKQFIFLATFMEPILLVFIPLLLFGKMEGSKAYYLAIGEISGVIILLLITLFHHKYFKFSLKWALILFLHFFILVVNPARGAIIFTTFLLVLWTGFHVYKLLNPKILLGIFITFIFGGFIIFQVINYFPDYSDYMINRMAKLFEAFFNENNSLIEISTFQRLQFWEYSRKMIFESGVFHFFLGHGIGSFGILFAGNDTRLYPHNMFIEAWFELGLIGVSLLMFFFAVTMFTIIKNKNSLLLLPMGIVFLDAMKSFSLPDLRILFSMLAIALAFNMTKVEYRGNFFENLLKR